MSKVELIDDVFREVASLHKKMDSFLADAIRSPICQPMSPGNTLFDRIEVIDTKVNGLIGDIQVLAHAIAEIKAKADHPLFHGYTAESAGDAVGKAALDAFLNTPFDALVKSSRIREAVARVDAGALEMPREGEAYKIPPAFIALCHLARDMYAAGMGKDWPMLGHTVYACECVLQDIAPTTPDPEPLTSLSLADAIVVAGDRGAIRRAVWAPSRTTAWAEIQLHWHSWFTIFDYVATDWEIVPMTYPRGTMTYKD